MNLANTPFTIENHKKKFRDTYLEVIINPLGGVEYAVPSHTLALSRKLTEKTGWSYEQQNDIVAQEYYADMMLWFTRMTGYIAVWNDFYEGEPNTKQLQTLMRLKSEGLYFGSIFRYGFIKVQNVDELFEKISKPVELLKKFPSDAKDKEHIIRIILAPSNIITEDKTKLLVRVTEDNIRGFYSGRLCR